MLETGQITAAQAQAEDDYDSAETLLFIDAMNAVSGGRRHSFSVADLINEMVLRMRSEFDGRDKIAIAKRIWKMHDTPDAYLNVLPARDLREDIAPE